MRAARNKRPPVSRGPLWRSDARECLRLMLPELAVTVVASTCLSTIMVLVDGVRGFPLVTRVFFVQLLTQAILYVCTYLTEGERITSVAWMLPMLATFPFIYLPSSFAVGYQNIMATVVGTMLFYVTRLRSTFVLLIIQILALAPILSEMEGVGALHFLGVGALMALFAMRSSATRITRTFVPWQSIVQDKDTSADPARRLRMYRQVAAAGVTFGALCLAGVLAGALLLGRGSLAALTSTGSTDTATEEQPATTTDTGSEAQVVGGASEGTVSGVDDESSEAIDPADEDLPAADGSADAPHAGTLIRLGTLLALALALAMRLTRNGRIRRSIEREPRAADRVARIYLQTLACLEVVGIVRDEAETPREFYRRHKEELAGLTEPAGFGCDEWGLLTEAYERARYADLDPTAPELETCWQLYDALSRCVRETVGWLSYLIATL